MDDTPRDVVNTCQNMSQRSHLCSRAWGDRAGLFGLGKPTGPNTPPKPTKNITNYPLASPLNLPQTSRVVVFGGFWRVLGGFGVFLDAMGFNILGPPKQQRILRFAPHFAGRPTSGATRV